MRPEAFAEIRRRMLWQVAVLGIFVALFLAAFLGVRSDLHASVPIAFVVVGFAVAMGARSAINRAQRQLESFRILLEDDSIRRRQEDVPDVIVERSAVTAIEEREGQGIAVYGADRRSFVPVPIHVEHYTLVRQQLARWRPIEPKPPAGGAWTLLVTIAVLGGFAVVALTTDRLLIITVGSALAIALLVCIVLVLRSPHASGRLKRNMLVAILPLAAIIARVVLALGGR